jgi:hypothetical protein
MEITVNQEKYVQNLYVLGIENGVGFQFFDRSFCWSCFEVNDLRKVIVVIDFFSEVPLSPFASVRGQKAPGFLIPLDHLQHSAI